jgi:hypothetical protein
MSPYKFTKQGRNPATSIGIALMWTLVAILYTRFDAHFIIVAVLIGVTLPACLDWIKNPQSGLDIDPTRVRWYSAKRQGQIAHAEIDHFRFHTGLDGTRRIVIVDTLGRKTRIPYESTPPHKPLKHWLRLAEIPFQDRHFSW